MSTKEWLSLMEYSNKYRLSPSTIRRRIKSSQIKYRLSGGKYFIYDDSNPYFFNDQQFENKGNTTISSRQAIDPYIATQNYKVDSPVVSKSNTQKFVISDPYNQETKELQIFSKLESDNFSYGQNSAITYGLNNHKASSSDIPFNELASTANRQNQESSMAHTNSELDAILYHEQNHLLPAFKLLEELKDAYQYVLNEKNQNILDLQKENNDLKTLVRVLEDEVKRLIKKIK